MPRIQNSICVAGSRNLDTPGGAFLLWQLEQDLRLAAEYNHDLTIIEGEAIGIDIASRNVAGQLGLRVDRNPVTKEEWDRSRGAGYARNQRMVDKTDRVWVYWNGQSRGCWHTATITYAADKLEMLVYGNGLVWHKACSRWNPITFGEHILEYDELLSNALSACQKRNRESKSMLGVDGKIDRAKLNYANARARDAYNWLAEYDVNIPDCVRVPREEDEADYVGWYRFPSKSRGKQGKFHYTLGSGMDCTCEGWHPEKVGKAPESRQVCWHLMTVWMLNRLHDVLLPNAFPIDNMVGVRKAA